MIIKCTELDVISKATKYVVPKTAKKIYTDYFYLLFIEFIKEIFLCSIAHKNNGT